MLGVGALVPVVSLAGQRSLMNEEPPGPPLGPLPAAQPAILSGCLMSGVWYFCCAATSATSGSGAAELRG